MSNILSTNFCEPHISKTIKARNLKQRQIVQHVLKVIDCRNDRSLDLNVRKIRQFFVISSWIRLFTGIKDIKLNKILYVTYS